jgi:hypothetical protein
MTGESAAQLKRWERWQSHNDTSERRWAVASRVVGTLVLCAACIWVFVELVLARSAV